MALPRRKSRSIVVDGVRYRWMSELPDDMVAKAQRTVAFVVQRDDGPGARLRAAVRWATVVSAYRGACAIVERAAVLAQAERRARMLNVSTRLRRRGFVV